MTRDATPPTPDEPGGPEPAVDAPTSQVAMDDSPDLLDLQPAPAPGAGSAPDRRRWMVAVAAVVVGALAVTFVVALDRRTDPTAVGTGPNAGKKLPRPFSSRSEALADAAAPAAGATAAIAPAPYGPAYVLGPGLGPLPATGIAWEAVPADAADVAKLAAALGITGPVTTSATAFDVRAGDATLHVERNGAHRWFATAHGGALAASSGSAPNAGSGGAGAGSSGSATAASPPADKVEPAPPASKPVATDPDGSVSSPPVPPDRCASVDRAGGCPGLQPPSEEANRKAQALASAVAGALGGIEGVRPAVVAPQPGSWAAGAGQVVSLRVGGIVVDALSGHVGTDVDGAFEFAGGTLAGWRSLGQYPTLSAEAVFERLTRPGTGSARLAPGVAVDLPAVAPPVADPAATTGVVVAEPLPLGKDAGSTPGASGSATDPVPTIGCAAPAGAGEVKATVCAPDVPVGPPPPVKLTAVRPGLILVEGAERAVLEPSAVFTTEQGWTVEVPALAESAFEDIVPPVRDVGGIPAGKPEPAPAPDAPPPAQGEVRPMPAPAPGR